MDSSVCSELQRKFQWSVVSTFTLQQWLNYGLRYEAWFATAMNLLMALLFAATGKKMFLQMKRNFAYNNSAKYLRRLKQVLYYIIINYYISLLLFALLTLLAFFATPSMFSQVGILAVVCFASFLLRALVFLAYVVQLIGLVNTKYFEDLLSYLWVFYLVVLELIPEMITLFGMSPLFCFCLVFNLLQVIGRHSNKKKKNAAEITPLI